MVFPDIPPMRVLEEPVCIYLFRPNPVFTSLHLRFPVHVVPPLVETEANGNTKSTNERGPSLVGPLGSSFRFNISWSGSRAGSPVSAGDFLKKCFRF